MRPILPNSSYDHGHGPGPLCRAAVLRTRQPAGGHASMPHSMIAKSGRILQLIASGNGQQKITCASPKREDRHCKTDSKPETIQNVIASITKHI
jgi:hypothetical protein